MFNTASRRASAYSLKTIRYPQPLSRTISNTTRPKISNNSAFRYLRPQFSPSTRIQTRNLSHAQRIRFTVREASRGIWRKNPIVFPLTVVAVVGSLAFLAYVTYTEVTFVQPKYSKFPPQVADSLRTAIYYTEVSLNPPKALNAYKDALRFAEELKMDPMSNEVLGIRIQVAAMLEKGGLIKPAIEVLERVKLEARVFVDKMAQIKPAKKVEDFELFHGRPDPIPVDLPEVTEVRDEVYSIKERMFRKRACVLRRLIFVHMRLAELYSVAHLRDDKKIETNMTSAVELCLKEMQHRQKLGFPVASSHVEEDEWLSLSEMAVVLKEPADLFWRQHKDELALPLYLRALDLVRAEEVDTPTCKQVVLLTCIAATMSSMVMNPRPGIQPIMERDQTMQTAKQWGLRAIELSEKIKAPLRDSDCDDNCATAVYCLGEMAEFMGKVDEARKYFDQSKRLAQPLGFTEIEQGAEAALERLAKPAEKGS